MAPDRRAAAFGRLDEAIQDLNRRFAHDLALPLTRAYGDEVAGLLLHHEPGLEILDALRESLHPDGTLRCVIAAGQIGVPSTDIRRVGGEVFKKADEEIRQLGARNGFFSCLLDEEVVSLALTALVNTANALIERMTPYQRSVWRLAKQGLAQREIAERLGKFAQSVSDAARRAAIDTVVAAENAAKELLSKSFQR